MRRKAEICIVCGSTELYRGQYCRKCANERKKQTPYYTAWLEDVNKKADIKRQEFLEKGDFGEFEYVGGFTSGNCKIVLRCKICGEERLLTIDGVRSSTNGHNVVLQCKKCHPNKGHRNWEEWLIVQRERGKKQREIKAAMDKKEKEKRKITGKCAVCGKEFVTFCQTQKTCGGECKKQYRRYRVDHRIQKDAIVDKDITLATLYKRDKGICYICGRECDWNDIIKNDSGAITGKKYPSIDHVIPLSRGGKHAWTNVRLACRECNSKKTDISPAEYLGTNDFVPENAEILKRIPNKNKKTVEQRLMNGELIATFESTAQAARETGFKEKQIQNCARGECKTYRGFLWAYC